MSSSPFGFTRVRISAVRISEGSLKWYCMRMLKVSSMSKDIGDDVVRICDGYGGTSVRGK